MLNDCDALVQFARGIDITVKVIGHDPKRNHSSSVMSGDAAQGRAELKAAADIHTGAALILVQ